MPQTSRSRISQIIIHAQLELNAHRLRFQRNRHQQEENRKVLGTHTINLEQLLSEQRRIQQEFIYSEAGFCAVQLSLVNCALFVAVSEMN